MVKDSDKIIKFGNNPVIVLFQADDNYRPFFPSYTQLVRLKEYGQLFFTYRSGRYDFHVNNVSVPPPTSLAKYKKAIKNDEVTVYKLSA